MKKIFILALFFSIQIFAEDQVKCPTNNVPIKLAGFLGYGDQFKIIKQIAQLVTPSEGQISSYNKSFEIGKYRFVRNENKWDIYRKNENGQFEIKDFKGKFLVDADQSIWATAKADGSINLHRIKSADEFQRELNVFFTRGEIFIKDQDNEKVFSYKNCVPATSGAKTAKEIEPKNIRRQK